MLRITLSALAVAACALTFAQEVLAPQPVDGFDFGDQPGVLYIAVRDLPKSVGWDVAEKGRKIFVHGVPAKEVRRLYDGTNLVSLRSLKDLGAWLQWDAMTETATLGANNREVRVHRGVKRVAVSKRDQRLRAWQGSQLVLDTHVSTGKKGHTTPSGEFAASTRERIHYSSIYEDSPMPYAVQVNGNIFIHGFTSVPRRPASHGCIRMPLTGKNPARWFYGWVTPGTSVSVGNDWPEPDIPTASAGGATMSSWKPQAKQKRSSSGGS